MLDPKPQLRDDCASIIERLEAEVRRRKVRRPAAGADPDDPAVLLWWLLQMAVRTRRNRADPRPVDAKRLARLQAQLAHRPARDEQHGQLHIDAASTLRRADAVAALADGPVIAVGDDDALTLALVELGLDEVWALDIDPRVLAFLREASDTRVQTMTVDVLEGPVPAALLHRFSVAVTDPYRDLDGGLGFLTFAAACVGADGAIAWVDHPDWNFEHDIVRQTLEQLGWHLDQIEEDVHEYPLAGDAIDLRGLQALLSDDSEALRDIVTHISAWSHLHVLRRADAIAPQASQEGRP